MSENNGNDTSSEADDFWDIDKLVPKKSTVMSPFSSGRGSALYEVTEPSDTPTEKSVEKSERKLTFSDHASEIKDVALDESYVPTVNKFIKKVTVKSSNDKYDFYGNFRKAALIYHDYKTDKCDYVPFFSYMPQYSQLNPAQKNYYFYWRSEIRRGHFPKTDYSYLYLYVYEILNLPDKIPAEEGIKILAALWREYRVDLPKIGANFSVWIQDYCLIHRLPCPTEELKDFLHEVIAASAFKEFYLSDIAEADGESIGATIAFLSDYDWRKGKFIEEADTELYKKHMYTAMRSLLLRLDSRGELCSASGETQILSRNAFPNSLCTHSVKCRLEIEYISLEGADGLRCAITAAVRYTENKIRAMMGVKSRLAVKDLPDRYKEVIDAYFNLVQNADERIRAKEKIPEYERLYDAPSEKLSFAGADEIERASWATTQRLVVEEDTSDESDGFESESRGDAPSADLPSETASDSNSNGSYSSGDTYGLSDADVEFLSSVYNGAEIIGLDEISMDSAAERINEAFSEQIGDVVLYHDGEKYMIYDDYTEEIGEWLLKLTK